MRFDPEAWRMERATLGSLNTVLISPAKELPQSIVVLCHGFGASGTDLVGCFEDILECLPEGTRKSAFLFPEAPIDLSDEGMYGARAWWSINMAQLMQMNATDSFDQMREAIPPGIDSARTALCKCIQDCQEKNQWSQVPIILGGFSQGAMLVVDVALRGNLEHVAGLLVFSGALVCESLWRDAAKSKPLNIPIVQSHGRLDQVLSISTGRWLHSLLKDVGCQGSLIEFNGPHTIPGEATEQAASLIAMRYEV
jgi:phospholipase/carboxylesterase